MKLFTVTAFLLVLMTYLGFTPSVNGRSIAVDSKVDTCFLDYVWLLGSSKNAAKDIYFCAGKQTVSCQTLPAVNFFR